MEKRLIIPADKVFLTAGFYREYLGFQEVLLDNAPSAYMIFYGQSVLILPKNHPSAPQKVSIELLYEPVDVYFDFVKDNVNILEWLHPISTQQCEFSFRDCDNNHVLVRGKSIRQNEIAPSSVCLG